MGLDVCSKVYFGFFDKANLKKLPRNSIQELEEDGCGTVEISKDVKIYLEPIWHDDEMVGIGVPISEIHNRSDDFWFKSFAAITDEKTRKAVELLSAWGELHKVQMTLFHCLTWSQ